MKYLIVVAATALLRITRGQSTLELERDCPAWGAWQYSPCWWPNLPFDAYPCNDINPYFDRFPTFVKEFFVARYSRYWYEMEREQWVEHGRPAMCGNCAVRLRCRNRRLTTRDEPPAWCKHSQHETVARAESSCPGVQPCQFRPSSGVCVPPSFVEHDKQVLARFWASGEMTLNYAKFGNKDTLAKGLKAMIMERVSDPAERAGKLAQVYRVMALNSALNQTNCIKSGDVCLCCCAPFMPNAASRQCEDVTALFTRQVDSLVGQLTDGRPLDVGAFVQADAPPPPSDADPTAQLAATITQILNGIFKQYGN